MTGAFAALVTLVLIPPGGAVRAEPVPETVAAAHSAVTPTRRTDAVVVISLDGLRPDAIARFDAELLQRMVREGSYSLEAQTILPSKTLPSHTSMLTGVEPAEHGITWNDNRVLAEGVVAVPTAFGIAREAGLKTAAFFSKDKFQHLVVPGTIDYAVYPGSGKWSGEDTAENVEAYLARGEKPDLLFVHIPDADSKGHFWGWMSWMYGRAVDDADDAVESVLNAADRAYGAGNYTVIVTADHGGAGRSHGSDDPRDRTIPWIAWGKGVRPGALGPGIRTIDTASTALWLLGVAQPETVDGRAVTQAFGQLPELAAQ